MIILFKSRLCIINYKLGVSDNKKNVSSSYMINDNISSESFPPTVTGGPNILYILARIRIALCTMYASRQFAQIPHSIYINISQDII